MDLAAPASLMLMAILWGSTFFVIKDLLTRIDAADLLGVRFTIAALVLVAVLNRRLRLTRTLLRDGLVMGGLYGSGQLLQTYGLAHTSASISGFLTGLYVVATPMLEAVLLAARVSRRVWLAVALATAGLGTLTIAPGLGATRFGLGEALTVLSALAYAGHIVYTGRVTSEATVLRLSTVQTITIAVMCTVAALPGGIALPQRAWDWWAVGYLAVLCGALAVVLQVWAQARVEATRAAVIMSSEPIWAATFAIAAGQEDLAWRTVVGGTALVLAMILASLPDRSVPRGSGLPRASVADVHESGAAQRGDVPGDERTPAFVQQRVMDEESPGRTDRPDELDGLLCGRPGGESRHQDDVDALRHRVQAVTGVQDARLPLAAEHEPDVGDPRVVAVDDRVLPTDGAHL